VFEPLEQRALLDAVGLSSAWSEPEDDGYVSSGLGATDHPLSEMFEVEPEPSAQATYVPGEILIKVREHAAASPSLGEAVAAVSQIMGPLPPEESLGVVMSSCGATSLTPVFPGLVQEQLVSPDSSAGSGASLKSPLDADREDLGRWYHVQLSAGADIDGALAALTALPEVTYAEPNYEWGLTDEIPPVIEGLPDGTTDHKR